VTHHKLPEIEKRLARIEGHVHGVRKMAQDGRTYSEISQQISAIISALDSVRQVIIDDLVEATISNTGKRDVKESAQELRDVIEKTI
jgi:DNA-binding FrmR family transcriptional regulator